MLPANEHVPEVGKVRRYCGQCCMPGGRKRVQKGKLRMDIKT